MLKTIALTLLGLIGAVLLFATTRPDSFSVERRISILAPPDKIQPMITDFRRWAEWSPWEKLDPAMKRTFGGPPAGRGATYAWQGNKDVGSGRMEVTSSEPAKVSIKLDFIEPFAASNTTEFLLSPTSGGTEVRWVMSGPATYVTKLMGIFVSMDKMVGKDFEKGLSQMKAAAEK